MFGVRVYDLQVKQGPSGRRPLDTKDPLEDGSSAADRVIRAAEFLAARGPITKVPDARFPSHFDPTLPAETGDPQTTLLDPLHGPIEDVEPWTYGRAGSSHVLLKLEYGYVGEYLNARNSQSKLPIGDRAATGIFRALFMFPHAGTHARLIVESHGRVCPAVPLIALYAWAEHSVDSSKWTRLRAEQMADLARLRALANEAESVDIVLSRRQPGLPGGNNGQRVTLSTSVKETTRRDSALSRLVGWVDGGDTGEYVSQLESIAGYDPEDLERANLRFDEAAVEIRGKDGRLKKITPSNIRARFTYDLTQLQLDDTAWLERVRSITTGDLLRGTEISW